MSLVWSINSHSHYINIPKKIFFQVYGRQTVNHILNTNVLRGHNDENILRFHLICHTVRGSGPNQLTTTEGVSSHESYTYTTVWGETHVPK